MIYSHELMKLGGKWLGAARTWLQWHTINGDRVTWNSGDEIQPTMTVRMVEELAADVAAAAMNQRDEEVERQAERLTVQLAGCLTAAEGQTTEMAYQCDYDWSPAYQAVLDLRRKYDAAVNELEVLKTCRDGGHTDSGENP